MERNALAKQCLGPAAALLPWLENESVTDILVNGRHSLYVDSAGSLEKHPSPFFNEENLLDFIERILVPLGKRVDATQPFLDARLADGSRVHVILPPIASEGPHLSIRRFRNKPVSFQDFEMNANEKAFLGDAVAKRRTLLISGGTGAGKTSLLTQMLNEFPASDRIVVLEEAREIKTTHPHAVFLEARPMSPEGVGEVRLSVLIRQALRMRPDRIIVGECRGEEAFAMLQAMSTGHAGSVGTIHSNSARDALRRLENLAALGAPLLPLRALREWISSAIHAVIHLEREGPRRRVAEVIEVLGLEGEVYRVRPLGPLQVRDSYATLGDLREAR